MKAREFFHHIELIGSQATVEMAMFSGEHVIATIRNSIEINPMKVLVIIIQDPIIP